MSVKVNGNSGVTTPPPANYFQLSNSEIITMDDYNALVYGDIENAFFINRLPVAQPLVFSGTLDVTITLQGIQSLRFSRRKSTDIIFISII